MTAPAAFPSTPWPTNLGAYSKALSGAVALIPTTYLTMQVLTPATIVAWALALLAHFGVLLAPHHAAKVAVSWAGTLLSALALSATTHAGGVLTWTVLGHWSSHDLATVISLAVGSLLHTVVPNAPADASVAAPAGPALGAHLPDPEVAADGTPISVESVTALLPVVPAAPTAGGEHTAVTA